jgi:hypothetical protein
VYFSFEKRKRLCSFHLPNSSLGHISIAYSILVTINVYICCLNFILVLRIEPRALCIIGKCSTTWAASPDFCLYIHFWDMVLLTLPRLASNSRSSCLHLRNVWDHRWSPPYPALLFLNQIPFLFTYIILKILFQNYNYSIGSSTPLNHNFNDIARLSPVWIFQNSRYEDSTIFLKKCAFSKF